MFWDQLAEEEYHQAQLTGAEQELRDHEHWCQMCVKDTDVKCGRGNQLFGLLEAAQATLRMVQLKNKPY